MFVTFLDRPVKNDPPLPPSRKKQDRPNQYKLIFHAGTNGTCAGSYKILRSVFNYGQQTALETLIDSTLSRQEVLYQGSMDVVKTKLAEAKQAKKDHKEEFPRLKRVSFTFEPL